MKTKNLFRVLPAVAAVLLFAACSGDDQNVAPVTEPETPAGKGTVIHYSATVSDGTTTRATLNGSNEYVFQTGDKLTITTADGTLTGDLTLTEGDGTATATFAGDLTYNGEGTPADNLELQAVLVSTSNAMPTLTYASAEYPTTAIASTLAEAVQKYSYFKATSTYAAKSFSMDQQTSFLNFTVTLTDGTTAGTALDITITNGGSTVRTGSVTTVDDSGIKAKFVAAMPAGTTMSSATFQLGSKSAVSFGGTTTLGANKIYNISKTISIPGLLAGAFTVDSDGTQVKFAQGNLCYTSGAWSFFDNQWDYYTAYSADSWDKFGWSTSATTYGMNTSTSFWTYSGDFKDWGNTISDGYTWRTLSSAEWTCVFNTRTTGGTVFGTEQARYAHATINTDGTSVNGMILFPDGVDIASTEVTTAGRVNGTSAYATKCTTAQWAALAAKGCVFLPAAAYRDGTSVRNAGSYGYYWSSSPNGANDAYRVCFSSENLDPGWGDGRNYGFSVRLVRQVE
ncbi:MAG: hypothetical protein II886_04955 [Prevotella sp.]|nr:hypothetical protein [Prevotella sp.]